MEKEKTCCFTGHRPLHLPWHREESDLRCVLLKERLALEIERAYALGYRRFLCGMAMGTDLIAGEAVVKAKMLYPDLLLEAAVPCENQTRRWPKTEKARYEALLAQCDIVPRPFLPYDEDSMMRRNRYMVKESSRVIAVYDGVSHGGTRKTLVMALQAGLTVVLIDPEQPDRED